VLVPSFRQALFELWATGGLLTESNEALTGGLLSGQRLSHRSIEKQVAMKFRNLLDVVASVAMIAASCAILVAVFGPLRHGRSAQPPLPQSYAVGETLSGVGGLPSGGLIVLWLHTGCRYCEQSMPFYRRLSDEIGKPRVIAMGFESESALDDYLNKHGLPGTLIISVRPEQVKFSRTPTIAVLGPDRRVRGLWVGKLRNVAAEDEVLAMASRLVASETRSGPDRQEARPVLRVAGQLSFK